MVAEKQNGCRETEHSFNADRTTIGARTGTEIQYGTRNIV
jgi:hypothetical protein